MKKLIHSVLACLFFGSIALAEGGQSTARSIRLGMISPLTGDFAVYGEHIKRGVELAREELKSQGIATELFVEDACLATQARSALTKLVSVDRIDALAASYCVIGMVASEDILEKAKVVAFQTSGGTKEILDAGEFLFTTAGRTTAEAEELANHAYRNLGRRKAAVLYLTTQWGEEFKNAFVAQFSKLGGEITGSDTNAIGVNDFRSELLRLRIGNPDVLVIVHLAQTLGIAIKQSREGGYKQTILATTDAEEQGVIDVAGKYAEGSQFLATDAAVETDAMKKFNKEFQDRFQKAAHPLSRHSYDATMLTATALNECHLDHVCAKEKLYQLKGYSGASGVFSIEADGGVEREFVLKTVKDAQFVRVGAK